MTPAGLARLTDRRLELVRPELAALVRGVLLASRSPEFWGAASPRTLYVADGWRSRERQAQLWAQGRTLAGPVVTMARPGESPHERGAAVDFGLWPDGGDGHWGALVLCVCSFGLRSGALFRGLRDFPHAELVGWRSLPPWAPPGA